MLGCVPKLLTRLSETSLICEDRQGTGSISEDDIPVMRPFLTVIFQSFPELYKLLHLLLKGICSLYKFLLRFFFCHITNLLILSIFLTQRNLQPSSAAHQLLGLVKRAAAGQGADESRVPRGLVFRPVFEHGSGCLFSGQNSSNREVLPALRTRPRLQVVADRR